MPKVVDKNGKEIISSNSNTLSQLKQEISTKYPHLTPERQRFTEQNIVLQESADISKYETIIFKDLGFQIPWKTVFIVEYLGPLIIHALAYFYYNSHSSVQSLTFAMILLHFLKREYETVFVHRFSLDYMPWFNLPKNCFHYWVLGGLMMAIPIYSPSFKPMLLDLSDNSRLVLCGIWIFAQLSNLKTHLILRDLRPEGSKVRKIPFGYGFNLVSCPNYFFEILGWTCVTLITGSIYSLLFTVAGAVQMYLWALKKHARYKKEFGQKYPRNRKCLIPYLL